MFRLITFLSDYGLGDPFVGLCHAAILRACPDARIIDLSHAVAPHDVVHGAARLADAVPYVDGPAVHLAVVDPGVGTGRRALAIEAGEHLFVGPDNGLLLDAVEAVGGLTSAWALDDERLLAHVTARTFHGRDLFAPVTGQLAAGAPVSQLGRRLDPDDLVRLGHPQVSTSLGYLDVPVRDIDRFGNLQLACRPDVLEDVGIATGRATVVHARGVAWTARRVQTFGDLAPGEIGLLEDSFGWVAVIVGNGDAGLRLGIGLHEPVTLESHVEVDLDGSDARDA